jgi:hypothetical protein
LEERHECEHRKRDDDEIERILKERAVFHSYFGTGDGRDDIRVFREVNAAEEHSKQGHRHVGNERRYDFSERGTYDDSNCQIDDVALERERLEILQDLFHTAEKKWINERNGTHQ